MKKNLFKKGVGVLGAVLLLANAILPGMVAYAEPLEPSDQEPVVNQVLSCSEDSAFFCVNQVGYESFETALEAAKEGDEISLSKDISGEITINKSIDFNLNSLTLNGRIYVDGKINVTISNGTITDNSDVAIRAKNGANLTLSNNLNVTAQEAAVMAFYGSHITIEGGTYEAKDNFVVGTNGTYKSDDDKGGNTIIVNGGTFNGKIQSAGYVACGVYAPNHDSIKINGGTFNIDGGAGVVARAGNVNISLDAIFNIVGSNEVTGKVGDSRVVVPAGTKLVMDLAANYPGLGATPSFDVKFNSNKNDVLQNQIAIIDNSVNNTQSTRYINFDKDSEITVLEFIKDENNNFVILNEPEDPFKEGLIFDSWLNGEDVVSFDNTINSDLTLKASWKEPVAKLGDKLYASLQEAVDSSNGDSEIVLLKDVDISESDLSITTDASIDLNGKTINMVDPKSARIEVKSTGKLTINDSGENGKIIAGADANGSSRTAVKISGGEFVLNAGILDFSRDGDSSAKGFNGIWVLGQNGKVTINGGKIKSSVNALTTNNTATDITTITINGGEVESIYDFAIYEADPRGTIIITDGEIKGGAGAIGANVGTINIKGGKLISLGNSTTSNCGDGTCNMSNAVLNLQGKYINGGTNHGPLNALITSGEFEANGNSSLFVLGNDNVSLLIKSGLFSHNPDANYIAPGFKAVQNSDSKYVIEQDKLSSIMHDEKAFPVSEQANNGTSKKATYQVSDDGKILTVSGKIDYDNVHGSVKGNRYGVAVKFEQQGEENVTLLKNTFPNAKIYLNDNEYNLWDVVDGSLSSDVNTKSWPDGVYWYPIVTKSNQIDTIKIQWNDDVIEEYTINVVDAILQLLDTDEITNEDDIQDKPQINNSEIVVPEYDSGAINPEFTTTVGEGDDKIIYEGIPAKKVTLSENNAVASGDVASNSNFDAEVLGEFKIELGANAKFSRPLGIKLKTNKAARFKVKHSGAAGYNRVGLTTSPNATCVNGEATSNQYDGAQRPVDGSGYVTIYTCSASSFVAYNETVKVTPSSSSGRTSGGGSSSTTKKDDKKDDTQVIELKGEVTEESTTTGEVKEENTKSDVIISDAAKAAYNDEQLAAYQWAYDNGITTINDVDKARLSDPLTRAELAKMMSQYISSVLKKSPIKADKPEYKDVDESLGDLADFIVKAYQYQIMGINADGSALENFNPNGLVTRAEYATVFSRVLYGSANNQKDGPYYEKHLAALKEAGILTEDDPTIQEVRGWVMLMMYRSVNPKAPTQEEPKAEEGTGNVIGIANPASTYCVEQEGEIEIREDAEGAQYGVCKFKDGTEVEEWEYFRANHKDETTTGVVAESSTGAVAETTTGTVAENATGAVAATGAAENN